MSENRLGTRRRNGCRPGDERIAPIQRANLTEPRTLAGTDSKRGQMMENKREKPVAPGGKKYPRKAILCPSGPSDDEKGRAWANMINSPELAAYRVIGMMQPEIFADWIDAPTMLATLREQAAAVQGGDLAHAEAMLINQASALQALFVSLSERAMEQAQVKQVIKAKKPARKPA